MSEWEEFCDSNGWNTGSDSDYDKFLNSLEDRQSVALTKRNAVPSQDIEFFSTYEEAKQWAKNRAGRVFTRSPDGSGFIPKNK